MFLIVNWRELKLIRKHKNKHIKLSKIDIMQYKIVINYAE